MHTTPVTLLEQLRRPNAEASWRRFAALYTPLLYYWGRRLGLQEPDAADLVQDIFLVLLDKLPKFTYDQRGNFRGWLRTITFNKWRERQRRLGQRAHPMEGESLIGEIAAPECGAELDAAEELEYRQQLVGRALELIAPEFHPTSWKAFWRYVVENQSAADVARDMGLTVNALYIIKSRVLTRLRLELDGFID